MIREKVQLGAIASGLADLNEMRLSKFEFALLVTKMMEVAPHTHRRRRPAKVQQNSKSSVLPR